MKFCKHWFLLLLFHSLLWGISSAQYLGEISSITLSDSRESHLSTYTIISDGVDDLNTGNSVVAAGQLIAVSFPPGTDISQINSGTLTIGNSTYNLSGFFPNGSNIIVCTNPVNIPAGSPFTIVVDNVGNPPINSACGQASNDYAGAAPCNSFIQVFMQNALNDYSRPNLSHHNGRSLFTITPASFFISKIEVEKPNISDVFENALEQEIIRVNIVMAGSSGMPLQLEEMAFSTGSTVAGAARSTQLWTTRGFPNFHGSDDQLFQTISSPPSNVVFNPNYNLSVGNNYFWLTYHVGCDTSFLNTQLDALFDSLKINNQLYTATTPTGARTIVRNTTLSSSNLVPNPGFETYSSCPDTMSQISRATDGGE